MKLQHKCVQTFLDKEGKLIGYMLCYPVSIELYHELYNSSDEADKQFAEKIVCVKNQNRYFYKFFSEDFNEVKKQQHLIAVFVADWKLKRLETKKTYHLGMLSRY